MQTYTYSEARQKLATVLDKAREQGEVRIRRKGGQLFVLRPVKKTLRSPLDVQGIKTDVTTAEIVEFVHRGRRY